MQLSHASIIALLSLTASQAVAIPVQQKASGILARSPNAADELSSTFEALVARRSLSPQEAQEGRQVFARFASVADDSERSLLVVRELSKRGILDTLIAAIAQIVNELLGTASSSTAMGKRQGVLVTYVDDLVSSLVCLLESLLGLNTSGCPGPMRRDVSSSSGTLSFATPAQAQQSLAELLTTIGHALEQQGETLTSANSTSSSAAAAVASGNAAGGSKTKHAKAAASNSTSSALHSTTATGVAKGTKGLNSTVSANSSMASGSATATSAAMPTVAPGRRDVLTLDRRQTEGVQGLLSVLRTLLDTLLNTLLPMSSRSESSTTKSQKTNAACPPPGTPNNGQYIPGCPGYGRRDVGTTVLNARQADMLQSVIPIIQTLLSELPKLLSQAGNSTSNSTSSLSDELSSLLGGASTDAPSAAAVATSPVSSALSAAAATASPTKAGAVAAKTSPISAAKLSINARDLLEADGFERRLVGGTNGGSSQDGNTGGVNVSLLDNLLNNLLGGLLGTSSGSSLKANAADATGAGVGGSNNGTSQSGNTGGLNVSILNDLLNGLLGGLLGTSARRDVGTGQDGNTGGVNIEVLNGLLDNLLGGNSNNKRDGVSSDQSGNTGGINIELLNGLLNNVLGGNTHNNKRDDVSSQQNGNKGGINLSLLNGLLNNVLGGNHLKRAAMTLATRAVLSARADFKPVWDELKALGNQALVARSDFHSSGDHMAEMMQARSDLTPVWTSFRDMVDSAYAEGASKSSHQRRSPDVDTSEFAHATATFLKQKVFGKRSLDLKPLGDAATAFATAQMQEWTDALKTTKAH